MQHLFPFLVILLVIISKIVAKSQNQTGGGAPRTPRPGPTVSDEERRRRFMEAVGLPPDAVPPTPVKPRTAANPPPLLPVNPPGAYGPITPGRLRRVQPPVPSPAPAPRSQQVTRSIPRTEAPPVILEPAPMAPIPPIAQAQISAIPGNEPAAVRVKPVAIPGKGLMARLRDPASIREAVILREVLGPPRAFQPMWQ